MVARQILVRTEAFVTHKQVERFPAAHVRLVLVVLIVKQAVSFKF